MRPPSATLLSAALLGAALALSACDEPTPSEPAADVTPAAPAAPAAPAGPAADGPPDTPPPGRIQASPILERPVVVGGISEADVEAGIAAKQADIDRCYEGARADAPAPTGKVLVNFTITGSGAVGKVATRSSSLRHEATETCLNEQLAAARFPALERGDVAYVTYPFSFPTTTH